MSSIHTMHSICSLAVASTLSFNLHTHINLWTFCGWWFLRDRWAYEKDSCCSSFVRLIHEFSQPPGLCKVNRHCILLSLSVLDNLLPRCLMLTDWCVRGSRGSLFLLAKRSENNGSFCFHRPKKVRLIWKSSYVQVLM